jgi:hypothetical protein
MTAVPEPRARRRTAAILLGLAAAGLLVVAVFDPLRWSFYPDCPLSARTGLECAGCGTLRALHALTRGRWVEAFHQNPLILALAPLAAAVLVNEARVAAGRRSWTLPFHPGKAVLAVVVLLLVYVAARNLL